VKMGELDENRKLYLLSNAFVGTGAVKVHGKIYVVGGRNNSPDAAHQDSPAVDCFDPRSNCWSRCADVQMCRCEANTQLAKVCLHCTKPSVARSS